MLRIIFYFILFTLPFYMYIHYDFKNKHGEQLERYLMEVEMNGKTYHFINWYQTCYITGNCTNRKSYCDGKTFEIPNEAPKSFFIATPAQSIKAYKKCYGQSYFDNKKYYFFSVNLKEKTRSKPIDVNTYIKDNNL